MIKKVETTVTFEVSVLDAVAVLKEALADNSKENYTRHMCAYLNVCDMYENLHKKHKWEERCSS